MFSGDVGDEFGCGGGMVGLFVCLEDGFDVCYWCIEFVLGVLFGWLVVVDFVFVVVWEVCCVLVVF